MKTDIEKLIQYRTRLNTEQSHLRARLEKVTAALLKVDHKLGNHLPSTGFITTAMLEKLPFNKPLTGRGLRDISYAWRRFLELPDHVQVMDLTRCNISVEKAGTNGRRFIRREF